MQITIRRDGAGWKNKRTRGHGDVLARQARAKRPESRTVYLKLLGLECASDRNNFINGAGKIYMLSRSCTAVASPREKEEKEKRTGRRAEMKGTFNLQELAWQTRGDAAGIGNKYLVRWQRARRDVIAP